jgi:acetyltransferase-like isoleucine patch superfamily enzyme
VKVHAPHAPHARDTQDGILVFRQSNTASPLSPPIESGLLLVGGGRNAHNLIGFFEGAGIVIAGIVDDRPGAPVLGKEVGTIESVDGASVDAFLTVANPELSALIRERSALRGCRWPRFIHPTAVVSSYAQIGEGCYIGPFSGVTDATMGRHVHLFAHNVLGSRVEVGDFSVILPHATLASDVCIGRRCMIAMGACIHAGVTIGDDCRVGANVVVRHDMPAGTIALPAPTRVRSRTALRGG